MKLKCSWFLGCVWALGAGCGTESTGNSVPEADAAPPYDGSVQPVDAPLPDAPPPTRDTAIPDALSDVKLDGRADAPPPFDASAEAGRLDAGPDRDSSVNITSPLLLTTDTIIWAAHGKALSSPTGVFKVCRDHFPAGSVVRREIETAVEMYNTLGGSSVHLTVEEDKHLPVSELYGQNPTAHRFDYVDTTTSTYTGFPCHPKDDDTTCGSWVMNTCTFKQGGGWNGSGPRQFFTIGANANCYKHFTNPASSDHPNAHGVAHEIGHGWGMNHTPNWPDKDQGLLSTMQGTLTRLSAYDAAFIRFFYPPTSPATVTNLVLSPKFRVSTGGGWDNCFYEDFSGNAGTMPSDLYLDSASGELLDCNTGKPLKLGVTWFNRGTGPTPGVTAQAALVSSGAPAIVLKEWTTSAMPAQSQDSWLGALHLQASSLSGLTYDKAYTFQLSIDTKNSVTEDDESDNTVTFPMTVRRNAAACKKNTVDTTCISRIPD